MSFVGDVRDEIRARNKAIADYIEKIYPKCVSGYCPICLKGYVSNWEIQRCINKHNSSRKEGA